MTHYEYDIVVAGCGIAGSLAAVAAARVGMRVLAVEETGYPGGSMTNMGTGPMMTFHAGDTQVVRGLAQELVARMQSKGFSPGHTADSTGYTYSVTPFSAEGMKRTLEDMLLEAGATPLYHTMVTEARIQNGRLESVRCHGCGQALEISAQAFIDATGDGDLMALAGLPFALGRDGDGKDQPMTMNFKIAGVDTARLRGIMNAQPELFPFLCKKPGLEKRATRLSVSGFQDIMRAGIRAGEVTVDRDIVLCFETDAPGEMIVNMSRILDTTAAEPFSLSKAETEGRRQVFELLAYLKKRVPGFENARLECSGPSVGVRSSRRLLGAYVLTAEDLLAERVFPDRIAAFGYPIDIHSADGAETHHRFLRNGAYYTIPYRCLYSEACNNLLVAGRNISCTFEAQASTRLSPCCAALGQAAGTAAALAVKAGVPVTKISVPALQETLLREDAFIG